MARVCEVACGGGGLLPVLWGGVLIFPVSLLTRDSGRGVCLPLMGGGEGWLGCVRLRVVVAWRPWLCGVGGCAPGVPGAGVRLSWFAVWRFEAVWGCGWHVGALWA